MKKVIFVILTLCFGVFFTQCTKDSENPAPNTNQNSNNNGSNNQNNNGSNSGSCPGIEDNQIKIGDEVFVKDEVTANQYLHICMEYDFAQTGTPFLKHERSLYFKEGDFINSPSVNIILGHVPESGTTVSYTLDNGIWALLNSTASSTGKARISIDAYKTKNKTTQSWFSNEDSGIIEATADADGKVTFSFSDVKLVRNGGPLDEKLVICGKNILCQK